MSADEFAVEVAKQPAVRAAVFATVTLQEATWVVHSRWGKPWRDAALLMISGQLDARRVDPEDGDSLAPA